MSSTTTVPDDNLITRRKNITKGIEEIREKKSEIAKALRELGVSSTENTEENKIFIKQLVEAFDTLSDQETQYLEILKTIINIHEQATLDIAKEFEEKIQADERKLKERSEGKIPDENAGKEEEEEEEVNENTAANDDVLKELQEALLELKNVSQAAIAASELNEKLVERLQLQKKKKNAMMETRNKKAKELEEEASRVRGEVMDKINEMSVLKKMNCRQEKELEELRKQCLTLGLAMDTPLAKDAQNAVLDDSKRVPLIEGHAEKAEMDEQAREKRRQEIRENIKKEMEKKEQVNVLIREKLAAMDARRKRLQEIRVFLEKKEEEKAEFEQRIAENSGEMNGEGIPLVAEPKEKAPIANGEDFEADVREEGEGKDQTDDENDEEEHVEEGVAQIDLILKNAMNNLSNLTAMRERLEQIRENGGEDLNEDDRQLLQNLEMSANMEEIVADVSDVVNIEDVVRDSFNDALLPNSGAKNRPKIGKSSVEAIHSIVLRNQQILIEMEAKLSATSNEPSLVIGEMCSRATPAELRTVAGHLELLAALKETGGADEVERKVAILAVIRDILAGILQAPQP